MKKVEVQQDVIANINIFKELVFVGWLSSVKGPKTNKMLTALADNYYSKGAKASQMLTTLADVGKINMKKINAFQTKINSKHF